MNGWRDFYDNWIPRESFMNEWMKRAFYELMDGETFMNEWMKRAFFE